MDREIEQKPIIRPVAIKPDPKSVQRLISQGQMLETLDAVAAVLRAQSCCLPEQDSVAAVDPSRGMQKTFTPEPSDSDQKHVEAAHDGDRDSFYLSPDDLSLDPSFLPVGVQSKNDGSTPAWLSDDAQNVEFDAAASKSKYLRYRDKRIYARNVWMWTRLLPMIPEESSQEAIARPKSTGLGF